MGVLVLLEIPRSSLGLLGSEGLLAAPATS